MYFLRSGRRIFARLCVLFAAVLAGAGGSLLAVCGPFTDVSDSGFCPFVLEIFALGITTGTTPTTYDPSSSVNRLQMAAFLSRSVDRVIKRVSRRAALNQYWTTQAPANLGVTTLGSVPRGVQTDGTDVWVAIAGNDSVSRVRGSDGRVLETWTGANGVLSVLVAMGRVFATGNINPGQLYRIDPGLPPGAVTTVASGLGTNAQGIAFDGSRIWTGNVSSVSIVTPTVSLPWTVTTVSSGFSYPASPLYDGSNIWVVDFTASTLLKLDAFAGILQTVTVGQSPQYALFDGNNIWTINATGSSVTVVRASTGAVLATLTGNGLSQPVGAAFDGERVAVTNQSGQSVSLFKAADLTPLGSFQMGAGTSPYGACSDGVNFWITFGNANKLVRF